MCTCYRSETYYRKKDILIIEMIDELFIKISPEFIFVFQRLRNFHRIGIHCSALKSSAAAKNNQTNLKSKRYPTSTIPWVKNYPTSQKLTNADLARIIYWRIHSRSTRELLFATRRVYDHLKEPCQKLQDAVFAHTVLYITVFVA